MSVTSLQQTATPLQRSPRKTKPKITSSAKQTSRAPCSACSIETKSGSRTMADHHAQPSVSLWCSVQHARGARTASYTKMLYVRDTPCCTVLHGGCTHAARDAVRVGQRFNTTHRQPLLGIAANSE